MPARTTAVTQAKCWRVELWLKLRNAHTKPGFRSWKCKRRARRQAFRSEVNVPLPPRKVAISGAISRVLNHWGTECRVPKTALNLYASVPSLLQAHASLSVVKPSTAESGMIRIRKDHVKKRQVRLRVNGRDYEQTVEPRKLLVDFIREDLGLTGTHVGCEHGVCGACTILWDGEPVRSCIAF